MNRATRGRRGASALALGTLAAVAISGCASAVQNEETGPQTDGTPTHGGVVNIVQSADISPTTFLTQNLPNLTVNRLIFNYLTQYDTDTLEPQPELATQWELAEDGSSISLELRDDVVFHDGRPFTADDVIASVELLQRPEIASQMKHVAALVTDMVKVSDTAVTLTFEHGVSNLFDLFEMMPIIDVNTVDALLEGREFNGTGPFEVAEYSPGQGLELTKNEDYWLEDRPYLDGVNVSVVRDSQSMLSSLRSGQSQLAMNLTPLDASSLRDDPAYEVVESPAHDATYYLASNVQNPLLSDNRVRQAISYAVDRERILDQVLGGIGSVTSIPWSPASPAYDESLVEYYAYDPGRAGQLLEELGAAGSDISLFYDSSSGPATAIAEIVLFNLEEVGLNPTATPLQAAEFNERLRNGGLDGLFVGAHGFGQLSPATLTKGAFPFNAEGNASGFVSDEYKDLANRLWLATEEAELNALYDEMNQFLLDQQFVSDLVNSSYTYTISSELNGIAATMLDYLNLDEAHLG